MFVVLWWKALRFSTLRYYMSSTAASDFPDAGQTKQ
jgi:hypothetical protein